MSNDSIWACLDCITKLGQAIDSLQEYSFSELKTTLNFAMNSLLPYVHIEKCNTGICICVQAIVTSLQQIKQILSENFDIKSIVEAAQAVQAKSASGQKTPCAYHQNCAKLISRVASIFSRSSCPTKTLPLDQSIELHRADFLLNRRVQQFLALFPMNSTDMCDAVTPASIDSLIPGNPEAKVFWTTCFGDQTMIPWKQFFVTFEKYLHISIQENEERIYKTFLDFTQDNFVSAFEFSMFLRWFGPLNGCHKRLMEPIDRGMLAGFIPACEATALLQGKAPGTYLVRFSKSQMPSFAITFVDYQSQIKHCLLHCVIPHGLTLQQPPDVYPSLVEFVALHSCKLGEPLKYLYIPPCATKCCTKPCQGLGMTSSSSSNNLMSVTIQSSTSPLLPIPSCKESEEGIETVDASSLNCSTQSCVVCLDSPPQTVFLECGHLCCCKVCSSKLKQCPVCRSDIIRVVPVYRT